MNTKKQNRTKLRTICNNPRFYCLNAFYALPKRMVCECGGIMHHIGSIEGARLKVQRTIKKPATSAGRA